jgi:putative exosortase-associated protein (TIGR04073 family)
MLKTFSLLAALALLAVLSSGCANVERKLGRGLGNTFEIVRWGEYRRTLEQSAMFDSADSAYGVGMVRGFNRTLARTGIGIYEVVTCPIPPYGPVFTDHFAPGPVYPDNYKPGLVSDSMFSSDTTLGFAGGDVAPAVPGSRFVIFENH